MVETYDVVWGMTREGKFTEILHEMVEAETVDEAVRLSSLTAGKLGDLWVYKTYTDEAGVLQRGNFVRKYIPDRFGYTWVLGMEGPDVYLARYCAILGMPVDEISPGDRADIIRFAQHATPEEQAASLDDMRAFMADPRNYIAKRR